MRSPNPKFDSDVETDDATHKCTLTECENGYFLHVETFLGRVGWDLSVLKMALGFEAGIMHPAWLEFPAQAKDFSFFSACS